MYLSGLFRWNSVTTWCNLSEFVDDISNFANLVDISDFSDLTDLECRCNGDIECSICAEICIAINGGSVVEKVAIVTKTESNSNNQWKAESNTSNKRKAKSNSSNQWKAKRLIRHLDRVGQPSSQVVTTPDELKPLLKHLKYAHLADNQQLPIIIANNLWLEQEKKLLQRTSSAECRLALGKDWSGLVSIETNPTQSRLSADSDATESD
ncbi:hypothetical protein CR513_04197, partial [Mucuna pruriens]